MASEKTNSASRKDGSKDDSIDNSAVNSPEDEQAEGVSATMRAMTKSDLPEVLRIEHQSYQLPWTKQIFRDCLKVGYHMLVLDSEDGLSGFVIFSSAAGESHILNLCIDPAGRRQGFAEALLTQAIATVIVAGASVMFLEVRVSNRAAIRLYEKLGFVEAGRRPNYYKVRGKTSSGPGSSREDALVMARDLTSID